MNYTEFVRRFPEDKEIGRDTADEKLAIYRDNGTDVGVWRENRRTTRGIGEVLSHADAEMARNWFSTEAAGRSC